MHDDAHEHLCSVGGDAGHSWTHLSSLCLTPGRPLACTRHTNMKDIEPPLQPVEKVKVPGLEPDAPTITNEAGGRQSDTPYGLVYIPPLAILEESKILKRGKEKYGLENWTKIPIEDHLNHCLQHIYAYLAGDRSDNHLGNLSCRSHFALELELRAKRDSKIHVNNTMKNGL